MNSDVQPAPAPQPRSSSTALRLSFRQSALTWASLILLAALAWVVTLKQAGGMGIGPGTMGMALPFFLAMWVTMMAAMMFPSVAPVAILWTRAIGRKAAGVERARRTILFVAGYLLAWSAYGLVAFAALLGTQRLVRVAPHGVKWLGVAIFAGAGLYQLTPLKDRCLAHCRSPLMQLLHYSGFRGRARDLRVGLHHGAYCVGCCWGLMVVLIALGVMNVAAMAGLAVVIFLEKLSRHGRALARVVGLGFLGVAVLAPFHPWLLPALRAGEMGMQIGHG
jgi:predicted metal-binding membrane protein